MRLPAALVLLCSLLVVAVAPAAAHQYKLGPIIIVHPHAVSLVPGRPVAVYMTVVNKSDSLDRMVAVHCPRAGKAELHEHVMSGDVMMMKEVSGIDIPAHGKAELKPGGYHVMLFDVTGPLKPGDRLPMEIEFESAGRASIEAVVTKPGAADMDMSGHTMDNQTQ